VRRRIGQIDETHRRLNRTGQPVKAEWALRLKKLSGGRNGLSVVFDMRLCRFRSVMHGVFVVTAS
jgi:hypothetical protein